MNIQFAITDEQLLKCRDAVINLRPHISKDEYLQKAKLLLSEGPKMIYIEDEGIAAAFSVFRINYYFYRGKNMYIDDLGTLPEYRGKGYAGALLDFLKQYANFLNNMPKNKTARTYT